MKRQKKTRSKRFKFSSFTKTDYYGFAGAKKFPNGSKPLICGNIPAKRGVGIGYDKALVILDGKGVFIYGGSKKTTRGTVWFKNKKFSNPAVARTYFERVINVPANTHQLKELGFKKMRT